MNELENSVAELFLEKFCIVKEKSVYIDYYIFKYFANAANYNTITLFVVNCLKRVLEKHEIFTIHLSLKSLTLKELDKHYSYIANVCTIFKNEFPDKLDSCFIYNAPFVFTQIISIISVFVDKKTQKKIQLVDKSTSFEIL
jgi:hypothetical protein